MINVVHRMLSYLEINTERLLLEWVSAAEGPRFAHVVTGIINRVKELGPLNNDAKNGIDDLNFKLQAAKQAVCNEKLRWVAAKQTEFMCDGNKYGEIFTSHEIGRLLDGVITEEITLQQILLLLGRESLSIKDISERLKITPPEVFKRVQSLRKKELVEILKIRGRSPLYTICESGV